MSQIIDDIEIPDQFDWVDFSDNLFRKTFIDCIKGSTDIFVSAKAGVGKSLMIKIIAAIKKNVVVLSTTGLTAMALNSEDIPAKTLHSFFGIAPLEILNPNDINYMQPKNARILKKAEIIIIDEVSMMSNQLFDFVVNKINYICSNIPRMILFGDVMQLPPVVNFNNPIIKDYYDKKYNGKIMFFNSNAFKNLNFKKRMLRKSYRQSDQELADHLFDIGFKEFDQNTLNYFNTRVQSLDKFKKQYQYFMYMTPTNNNVAKMNNDYINSLTGKEMKYTATKSKNWPKNQNPADDLVIIKEGAQVMCTMNRENPVEGASYRNGTIGTAVKVDPNYVEIELPNGRTTKVLRGTINQYELDLDKSGNIIYNAKGWYSQIECKVCKAITPWKAQGKSFDAAYLALSGWNPPGMAYVALSRITNINGLGLSRELKMTDININEESYEFLEM